MKQLVIEALRRLGARNPLTAVLLAHILARATRPLGRGIGGEVFAALFPGMEEHELRRARQSTWEAFLKGEALEGARSRDVRGVEPRVLPGASFEVLRSPHVLVGFHVGPFQMIPAVIEAARGTAVVVHGDPYTPRAGVTFVHRGATERERARAFHQAVDALRNGSSALLVLDAYDPAAPEVPTLEVPLLGRTMPVPRGPFAAARIARVPIVPIVTRWRGTAVETELGPAVDAGAGEQAAAEAVGRWFDRYFRERPGELSVFMLERLRPPLPRR